MATLICRYICQSRLFFSLYPNMPEWIELILAVKKYPVLFEKTLSFDYHQQKDIWEKIAKNCDIQSGIQANKIWTELVRGYIDFLREGKDFDYENEMLFLQSHLISMQSDSDEFDADEIQRALESDSETYTSTSLPIKRKIASSRHGSKAIRKRLKPKRSMIKSTQAEKTQANPTADSSTAVDSSTASSNVSGLSSLQLIFLGYAKVLQDLPLPIQIKTKHKIAQIMSEAEMSLFEVNDEDKDKESEK